MQYTRHGNREIYKVMSPGNFQSSSNTEEPGIIARDFARDCG